MQIGQLLKLWREYRGLSQGELGEKAGYKQAQISDIETGKQKSVHPSTRRKLADALTISVEEFSGPPPNAPLEVIDRAPDPDRTMKEFDALYLDGMLDDDEIQDRLYRLRKMRKERGLGKG